MGIADGSGERTRLFNSLRNILYRHAFPLLSRERTEEQGHVGKYRDRFDDPWKDQDALLMFYLHPCLYR